MLTQNKPHKHATKKLIYIISILLLSGCVTYKNKNTNTLSPNQSQTESAENLNLILHDMHNNLQANNAKQYLMTADLLIQHQQPERAKALLANEIVINSDKYTDQLYLLKAKINLYNHETKHAIENLNNVNIANLETNNQIVWHHLKAISWGQTGDILESLTEQIQAYNLMPDKEKEEYNQQIWQFISQQPLSKLHKIHSVKSEALQGWIELANIAKNSINSTLLQKELQKWVKKHLHQAKQFINVHQLNDKIIMPKKIAVILPLNGPLKSSTHAIQEGIIATHYTNPLTDKTNLEFYDSSQKSIHEIFQEISNNNTDYIIGPLLKSEIETLTKLNTNNIPTTALNHNSNTQTTPKDAYYLSLSTQDEIKQIVKQAFIKNRQHAIIIQKNDAWGKKQSEIFQQEWETIGGKIIDIILIEENLNNEISTGLHITNSNKNHLNIQNILQQKIKFIPASRQDADVFFLAVTAPQARQIKPLLKYYFSGDIPIFSTSTIYTGNPKPYKDSDLNNIYFCDSKWALNSLIQQNDQQEKVLQNIQQKIKDSSNQNYINESRFYALGIDAYNSIDYLYRARLMPEYKISGATGKLSYTNNKIIRTLEHAKFNHGITQLIDKQPNIDINHVKITW